MGNVGRLQQQPNAVHLLECISYEMYWMLMSDDDD